jgi:hypothetical protein
VYGQLSWSPEKTAKSMSTMPGPCGSRASSAGTGTPITGEFVLVAGGRLTIQMRDRDVALWTRELFLAPRGVGHCRAPAPRPAVLPSEPGGVVNTGDLGGELIAEVEERA